MKVIPGVGNVDNAPWDKEKVWREVSDANPQGDEPIRSHLPNENYRNGWDETFGKKRLSPGMSAALRAAHGEGTWDGGEWKEVSTDEVIRISKLTIRRHG